MVYNHKGIDVFYKDFGEGDVSVFLHGYMEEHLFGKSFVKNSFVQ